MGNGVSNYATFSGRIFVNAGTVSFGNAGFNPLGTASAATYIASGATVNLNGQSSAGAEPFVIIGSGIGATGALTNSTGSSSITGSITLAGASSIGGAGNITLGGAINDGGYGFGLSKVGAGTVILTAANTYTGGTTIGVGAGTLQIGAGGTTGSLAGNIVDNASVVFNRTDSFLFSGAISGAGTVNQAGTGTLILDNTISSAVTISAGTLQIGNGGTTGAVTGNITDNANLVFNRSDNLTYAGVISGIGNVSQNGGATLTPYWRQYYLHRRDKYQ